MIGGIDQRLLGTWSLDLEVFLETMLQFATGMPGEIAPASGEHNLKLRGGDEEPHSADPAAGITEGEGVYVLATVLEAAQAEDMTTLESMHFSCRQIHSRCKRPAYLHSSSTG